jgi:hypothetical protein
MNVMKELKAKHTGYVNAEHLFGRSRIKRTGTNTYIMWQWHNDTDPAAIRKITRKQYQDIKNLIGPIKDTLHMSNGIKYIHEHLPKHYMRVRRYLKKEGIK